MLNDRSSLCWSGRMVEAGTIRYHPDTIRAAVRRSGGSLQAVEASYRKGGACRDVRGGILRLATRRRASALEPQDVARERTLLGGFSRLSHGVRFQTRRGSPRRPGTRGGVTDGIEIVGARTNNLKSVDVVLPLRKATMLVGVSGSGKSSLLAGHPSDRDQLAHAAVSPCPTAPPRRNGRSRLSRPSAAGDTFRSSRLSGVPEDDRRHFHRHPRPAAALLQPVRGTWADEAASIVPRPSPRSYAAWIERQYAGSLIVWTVVERWRRSDGMTAVARLRKHGFETATLSSDTDSPARRARGREIDLARFRPLTESARHLIEAEVGRVEVRGECPDLMPLLERAFHVGGDVIVEFENGERLPRQLRTDRGIQLDSAVHRVHPEVREPFLAPGDALLSFNSPSNPGSGACGACQGLGTARSVLVEALAAHPERSMHDGAFTLWTEKNYRYVNIQHETIEGLRGLRGFSPDVPWERLGSDARDLVLYGSGGEGVADIDRRTGRKTSAPRPFPGFVRQILRRADGRASASRLAASGGGRSLPGLPGHTLVAGSPGAASGTLGHP